MAASGNLELKTSLANMFSEMKADLKEHVDQCVATAIRNSGPNEDTWSEQDEESDEIASNVDLTGDLERFLSQDRDEHTEKDTISASEFQDLAQEFATSEKTSPPIDDDLVKIIDGLINDKLPKAKLDELTDKYARPENCKLLLAPKTNKTVWSQLKDNTKKADTGLQRCQRMFLTSAYAILECLKTASGEMKTRLVHALVLTLSGNREINLKRRELLKPDLNSQYSALCNASTPITTELFGDDVEKEIDAVTKANKLKKKLVPPRKSCGSRFHPYGQGRSTDRFGSSRGRYGGRGFNKSFLGERYADRRRSSARSASHTKSNQN